MIGSVVELSFRRCRYYGSSTLNTVLKGSKGVVQFQNCVLAAPTGTDGTREETLGVGLPTTSSSFGTSKYETGTAVGVA